MRRLALLLVAAAATLSASSAHATIVISNDLGGLISDYAARWISVRDSGEQVVIDGRCVAACTLVVGMVPREKVCATSKAVLGFQGAWRKGADGKRDFSGTVANQAMMDVYPADVRKWITGRGGLSSKILYLSGRELAEMVPPCTSSVMAKMKQDVVHQGLPAVATRPAAPSAPAATVAHPPEVAASISWPSTNEHRVALVIGNDSYPNLPASAQLQKAENDAKAVGEVFERLGFQVITGTNLGRQGMIDKLSELTARLAPGDTAAFFYAGHGVAIGGVNYLVPSDVPRIEAEGEVRARGASIAEGDVVAELQSKGVRVALLVLDACRDNPFPRSGMRGIGYARGLSDIKPARGIFTIYSAGIGQAALDGLGPADTNRNSVFTRIFVERLNTPGADLASIAIDVRERVADLAHTAKPEPHEQTPAYYDQTIGGRVYLTGQPRVENAPAKNDR
jgi:caspase domain-containing protein